MWRVVLGVLGLALMIQHASAQSPPISTQVNDAYTRGETLYQAGEYLAAAESFERVYALDPDPAVLFNIAQAYRFGNACAKAAAYYRKFLGAVRAPPNRAKVRDYIAEQDRCAKRQQADAELTAGGSSPTSTPPASDPGRTRRLLGIASGAVGLVAIGAGVYFTSRVAALEREHDACSPTAPCEFAELTAIDRKAERAELQQIISYTVGVVALAGGVVMYVTGRRAREQHLAIVPARTGGFVVGTFRF
jgi:tetratricopeptide (TPR) repeat protein